MFILTQIFVFLMMTLLFSLIQTAPLDTQTTNNELQVPNPISPTSPIRDLEPGFVSIGSNQDKRGNFDTVEDSNKTTTTTTAAATTIAVQTTVDGLNSSTDANMAYLNKDLLNNSTPSVKNDLIPAASLVKLNNYTDFAQNNGKLLINPIQHSNDSHGISRTLNDPSVSATSTAGCTNCTGFPLTIVLIVFAIIIVVIGIILSALFVMRRRFSIWRINGSKANDCNNNDGAAGVLTNASSSENNSTIENKATTNESNEKVEDSNVEHKSVANGMTSVENKQSVIALANSGQQQQQVTVNVDAGHSNEAAETNDKQTKENEKNEIKLEEVNEKQQIEQQQASPSSVSPLIDSNEESSKLITQTDMKQQEQLAAAASALSQSDDSNCVNQNQSSDATNPLTNGLNTNTSSSSLIANVLNELSESVANKLACKSPSKQVANGDPEKQPLNE